MILLVVAVSVVAASGQEESGRYDVWQLTTTRIASGGIDLPDNSLGDILWQTVEQEVYAAAPRSGGDCTSVVVDWVRVALSRCNDPAGDIHLELYDAPPGSAGRHRLGGGWIDGDVILSSDPSDPTWVTVHLEPPVPVSSDRFYVALSLGGWAGYSETVPNRAAPGPPQYCDGGPSYQWSVNSADPYQYGQFHRADGSPLPNTDALLEVQLGHVVTVRVLSLAYDPILEALNGMRVHEAINSHERLKAYDPRQLLASVTHAMASASGGAVSVSVVHYDLDLWPPHTDGWAYDDDQFIADLRLPAGSPRLNLNEGHPFDYESMLLLRPDGAGKTVQAMLNDEDVDEVWLWGETTAGWWEAAMLGPDPYWLNNLPVPTPSPDGFGLEANTAVMGFNYQVPTGWALHSYGHRMESLIFAKEGISPPQLSGEPGTTEAHHFVRLHHDYPDLGSVGTIHHPFNALVREPRSNTYDYSGLTPRRTDQRDWFNYPEFQGVSDTHGCDEAGLGWGCRHTPYVEWWLDHVPAYGGWREGEYGYINWWNYIAHRTCFPRNPTTPTPGP